MTNSNYLPLLFQRQVQKSMQSDHLSLSDQGPRYPSVSLTNTASMKKIGSIEPKPVNSTKGFIKNVTTISHIDVQDANFDNAFVHVDRYPHLTLPLKQSVPSQDCHEFLRINKKIMVE